MRSANSDWNQGSAAVLIVDGVSAGTPPAAAGGLGLHRGESRSGYQNESLRPEQALRSLVRQQFAAGTSTGRLAAVKWGEKNSLRGSDWRFQPCRSRRWTRSCCIVASTSSPGRG